jgi:hypothetical protein
VTYWSIQVKYRVDYDVDERSELKGCKEGLCISCLHGTVPYMRDRGVKDVGLPKLVQPLASLCDVFGF